MSKHHEFRSMEMGHGFYKVTNSKVLVLGGF